MLKNLIYVMRVSRLALLATSAMAQTAPDTPASFQSSDAEIIVNP